MNLSIRGIQITDLSAEEEADVRRQLEMEDGGGGSEAMIGTAEAARRLGVSTDYMRTNALKFGGEKLNADKSKSEWRFPAQLRSESTAATSRPEASSAPRRRRRTVSAVEGPLKIRGARPT